MNQPTKTEAVKITIEQCDGESFSKRVAKILSYYAKLDDVPNDVRAKAVRDSVTRLLGNATVCIRHPGNATVVAWN